MIRSIQSHKTALCKWLSAICIAALLLPIFAAAIYALPDADADKTDADTSIETSLPVWNGGSADGFGGGSGTQSDPYRISTGEELSFLAQEVRAGKSFAGEYFTLTADILLNNISAYSNWSQNAPTRRWIPIGGYATVHVGSAKDFDTVFAESGGLLIRTETGYRPAESYQSGVIYYRLTVFSGIFDGNGHTISGLYTADQSDYLGLFGACKNATLRNLTLTQLYVQGGDRVGGLSGALLADRDLTVNNCRVTGTVSGTRMVGGVAGSAETDDDQTLTISGCSFDGTVNGTVAVGGILGGSDMKNGALQLASCTNAGRITASSEAGGIVGSLSGSNDQISSCQNRGAMQAQTAVGGIAGLIRPGSGIVTVSNCTNGGTLLSNGTLGGIAGEVAVESANSILELLSCRNVGDLFGKESVGGIAGLCHVSEEESRISIVDAKNSATVSGNTQIGGLIGTIGITAGGFSVGTSENYGTVNAADAYAGGIVGYGRSSASLHLYECAGRASITAGSSYSGGIAGYLSAEGGSVLVDRCAVGGTIKADSLANGIAGGIAGGLIAVDQKSIAMIQNCLSAATLSAKGTAGGIAGELTADEGKSRIVSSLFCGGIVIGCKVTGGIAANAFAKAENSLVEVADCYFGQGVSTRAMLPCGGKGTESCVTTEAMSDADLRNLSKLGGLDFTIWQSPDDTEHYPTPGSIPFVWEEFQYTVTQDGAMLDAYLGRSDVVIIPEKLGGIAVTTISDQAFWQSDVIRVIMPDSVNAVGEAAFAGCQYLERVTLSARLVSVGARAFQGCTSLSELRCTETLSTLVVGGENEPYKALSLTHPVTVQVVHSYEDGSSAGKSTSLSCYVGDYYQIEPLKITGHKADASMLSGICSGNERVAVIYRIGTYRLTIRYLYPDGTEAFPAYEGEFRFGESYSIPTPALDGYSADRMLIDGTMLGEDTRLTVYFNQVYTEQDRSGNTTLEISLLILAGLSTVCCLAYFIYRYRSAAEKRASQDRF